MVSSVINYLQGFELGDRVVELDSSSATVELAAQQIGCDPERIAKTMAFLDGDSAVIVVMSGDARVDNAKFKTAFRHKASFVPSDRLQELVGHPMGGVCPFAIHEGVRTYLDESLRRFDVVYPAAGSPSAVARFTTVELEHVCQNFSGWIDVSKGWA